DHDAPLGTTEEMLARLWSNLLGVQQVRRTDNFFELGGHSLLLVQLMERLRREGFSTDARTAYSHPTIASLASILQRIECEELSVPNPLIPADAAVITPAMLPLIALTSEQIERIVGQIPGGTVNIQDIYPLTPLQEGILFHHLMSKQTADAYIRP